MNNMPPKLRAECAAEPFYRSCARREALHDHECQPDPLSGRLIEWEHAMIYASNQIQERWAVIPLCWYVHRGPALNKRINEWIALNRASEADIAKISKVIDYKRERERLNAIYGSYITLKLFEITGINYGREVVTI